MSAANRNPNCPRCKAINCWRSVDPDSQTGAVTLLVALSPIQAANMSVIHTRDQITVQLPYLEDHKSLMLFWWSVLDWSADCLAVSVAYKRCQYIGYAYQQPDHCSITILTRPHITDAPLTLSLRTGRWMYCCLFGIYKLTIHPLHTTAARSLFNYCTYKNTNCWRLVGSNLNELSIQYLLPSIKFFYHDLNVLIDWDSALS